MNGSGDGREQKRGRYKKFVEAVEKAQGEAEARDVALIAKQAPTDWRAAAWRLERRSPRRYGQKVQISIEQELEAALDRLKADGLVHSQVIAQEKLGQTADSKKTLADLIKRFPLSGEAQLARERLGTSKRR